MPKIQIDIPNDIYQKLKAQAKDDDRSLTKYITRGMSYLANIPSGYHNNPSITDLVSTLPEGTTATIRTTAKTKKLFSIPHRNIIKEAYDKEGIFNGRVHSNSEPFTDDEYREYINRYYPYCQNHPDFRLLKQYYDSFTSSPEEIYEARERFIGLAQIFECKEHERPYLLQAFNFAPPVDEPDISITEYISQLAQGGWYDCATEPQHLFPKNH